MTEADQILIGNLETTIQELKDRIANFKCDCGNELSHFYVSCERCGEYSCPGCNAANCSCVRELKT